MLRRRVATLAATATLLTLAACGGASSGSSTTTKPRTASTGPKVTKATARIGPFEVLEHATAGPGAELTDGLAMPAGTELLGAPFPDVDGKGGFVAVGLVTGDPVAVFNDLLDQAQGLGMSSGAPGGCLGDAASVTCARTLVDGGDGESLEIRVQRGAFGGSFVSSLALRYLPPGSVKGPVDQPGPTPPTEPLANVVLPPAVTLPSPTGINSGVDPNAAPLVQTPDTALVGPPGPCACAPGEGWSAVLHVEGDAAATVKDYAGQFGVTSPKIKQRTIDGALVTTADLGLVPGGFTQLRTVSVGGDRWLMITQASL